MHERAQAQMLLNEVVGQWHVGQLPNGAKAWSLASIATFFDPTVWGLLEWSDPGPAWSPFLQGDIVDRCHAHVGQSDVLDPGAASAKVWNAESHLAVVMAVRGGDTAGALEQVHGLWTWGVRSDSYAAFLYPAFYPAVNACRPENHLKEHHPRASGVMGHLRSGPKQDGREHVDKNHDGDGRSFRHRYAHSKGVHGMFSRAMRGRVERQHSLAT